MTLNLTLGHLAGFAFLSLVASYFLAGMQLIRAVGFIALWQLLTPARDAIADLLMLVIAWATTELLFGWWVRR